MGKRIPSKKHNKLKSVDPFNRKANSNIFKDKKDGGLRNLAPKKLSQEAPGSLKKLFSDQDSMEERPQRRKKRSNRLTVRTVDHRNDTESFVSQNTYETDDQFLRRVSQMANRARERADISVKFDVHFNEDGTVEHDLPEGTSLPTRKKRRLQEYKERQKKKMLKNKEKSQSVQLVKEEKPKEFPGRENFQFGEIVHGPPEITAKLRGAPEKDSRKIAKNLLCNPDNAKKVGDQEQGLAMSTVSQGPMEIAYNTRKSANSRSLASKTEPGEVKLEKIRWKKLEASKRAELEAERKRAIMAYRTIKNKV